MPLGISQSNTEPTRTWYHRITAPDFIFLGEILWASVSLLVVEYMLNHHTNIQSQINEDNEDENQLLVRDTHTTHEKLDEIKEGQTNLTSDTDNVAGICMI